MSVYVVQERKKFNANTEEYEPVVNLMPAAKFGDLDVLFDGNHHELLTGPTVRVLKNKLRNFSDEDYILPIGNPVLIGIVTAMAAKSNVGKVKVLNWDREGRCYIVLNYEL